LHFVDLPGRPVIVRLMKALLVVKMALTGFRGGDWRVMRPG
jgi:hypothetical protein